jgi:hypothetical protein
VFKLSHVDPQSTTLFHRFAIDGVTTTGGYTAFNQAVDANRGHKLYGLEIDRVHINNIDTCVNLRNVGHFNFTFNRLQVHRYGIRAIGSVLEGLILGNKFVCANESPGLIGLEFDLFNFTSGSPTGNTPPEGIKVIGNDWYGYDRCVLASFVNVLSLLCNTMDARIYGVEFATVQLGLTIQDLFVQLQNTPDGAYPAFAGVYGNGLSNPLGTKILIDDLKVQGLATTAAATTDASGVIINGPANQNQDYVTVSNGLFKDLNDHDIVVYNAGYVKLLNNRCMSTLPTYSISTPVVLAGSVELHGNDCAKDLEYTTAEVANGQITLGPNTKNGGTLVGHKLYGSATFDPGSLADGTGTSATVTVTGAALGDFARATFSLDLQGIIISAYVSSANTVSVRFQNETTGVLDLLSGTIRVEVTPAVI